MASWSHGARSLWPELFSFSYSPSILSLLFIHLFVSVTFSRSIISSFSTYFFNVRTLVHSLGASASSIVLTRWFLIPPFLPPVTYTYHSVPYLSTAWAPVHPTTCWHVTFKKNPSISFIARTLSYSLPHHISLNSTYTAEIQVISSD